MEIDLGKSHNIRSTGSAPVIPRKWRGVDPLFLRMWTKLSQNSFWFKLIMRMFILLFSFNKFHMDPGKLGLFHYSCAVYYVCKYLGTLGSEWRISLLAHYTHYLYHTYVHLTENNEHIKLVSCIFCRVCSKINSILSIIYEVLCVWFTNLPWWSWKCMDFILLLSSNRKHESLTIA